MRKTCVIAFLLFTINAFSQSSIYDVVNNRDDVYHEALSNGNYSRSREPERDLIRTSTYWSMWISAVFEADFPMADTAKARLEEIYGVSLNDLDFYIEGGAPINPDEPLDSSEVIFIVVNTFGTPVDAVGAVNAVENSHPRISELNELDKLNYTNPASTSIAGINSSGVISPMTTNNLDNTPIRGLLLGTTTDTTTHGAALLYLNGDSDLRIRIGVNEWSINKTSD